MLLCGTVVVTLSAISLPINLPVASTAFRVTLFEVVLSGSVADYLLSFWSFLSITFLLVFFSIFLVKDKNSYLSQIFDLWIQLSIPVYLLHIN